MKSAITALALLAGCASAQPYVDTMSIGESLENLEEGGGETTLDPLAPGAESCVCRRQWQQS